MMQRTLAQVFDQALQLKASVGRNLANAQRVASKLGSDLQALKDSDISADARERDGKELRATAQVTIGTAVRAINVDAATAAALKPRLADKLYWLSLEGDPVTRAQRLDQFAALPPKALQTAAAAALADRDLVSIYAAVTVGAQLGVAVDLLGVELQTRVAALRIIGEIQAAAEAAAGLFADAGRAQVGIALPTRKLALARAAKAMAPAATTRPSSPGRPPLPPLAS